MTQSEIYNRVHGDVVVAARWKVAPGQVGKVVEILGRFLPQAQAEPGVKLFHIARGKDDEADFLFYEVFADEDAFAAHQASAHFKTLIVGEALPLLDDRQRTQYTLL
jgi:quinol monooxygenase YgiN